MRIEHVDSGSVDEATILVEGLRQDVTLLQVTDRHLTEVDARDPDVLEAGEERRARRETGSPGGLPTREHFRRALHGRGGCSM